MHLQGPADLSDTLNFLPLQTTLNVKLEAFTGVHLSDYQQHHLGSAQSCDIHSPEEKNLGSEPSCPLAVLSTTRRSSIAL